MRILIMGAGLAGVTAAFELLEDGHDVVVIDRRSGPALETSFANAGLIAPGHALAWGSPRAPMMFLKSLIDSTQPIHYRFRLDPALWRWSLRFLRECTAKRARLNTERKHRLCRYAQLALQDVVARTGIPHDRRSNGLLYLYRKEASFRRGMEVMQIFMDAGQDLEIIDADRAVALDPALASSRDSLVGGFFGRSDESGDAHRFTAGLEKICAERGVRFRYETTVTGIRREGDRIDEVLTDKGALKADLYLMALGSYSPLIARHLDERLPIYPVKGYSATMPIGEKGEVPTMGGIDEDGLLAYAPLGDRLRITSIAEFAGYDTKHGPHNVAPMLAAAKRLFPKGADYNRVETWACLRPMTPHGLPILGQRRHRNLFYNTGHGHMGWTMACGTARITADLIAGRKPDLPLEGLIRGA